jgi:predicted transcriptional regulator
MKRRESIEIIIHLLEASSSAEGATRTYIVYRSGLSYVRCERYIDLLIKKGLLGYTEASIGRPAMYRVTNKGRATLTILSEVKDILYGEEEIPEPSPDLIFVPSSVSYAKIEEATTIIPFGQREPRSLLSRSRQNNVP